MKIRIEIDSDTNVDVDLKVFRPALKEPLGISWETLPFSFVDLEKSMKEWLDSLPRGIRKRED
jgi:hypothetical protein